MSKMYEALKRAQEQGIKLDVPVPILIERTALAEDLNGEFSDAEEPADRVVYTQYEAPSHSSIRQLPVAIPEGSPILPWDRSDVRSGEQYRIIRTRIIQHPLAPKMLVVSSAGSGDGKTVSSINIAGVLSLRDDATVLLIDGDFRRSKISDRLGLPNTPGLANVLADKCRLQDAIIRVEQSPNLYVLTAGASNRNPAELLDTSGWKSLCATVRERFDFVIVDAPPVAAVTDYELIQASCDGVIMIVRPDHTDRTLVKKAFDAIPLDKRVGVVLNYAYEWFLWRTHESYYYDSGSKR